MSETQSTNKPLTAAAGSWWDVSAVTLLADRMIWRLPGCSDLAVRMSLCEAWRQFCDQTEVWREKLTGFPKDCSECSDCGAIETAGEETVHRYGLYAQAACHIKSVFSVYVNDVQLDNDGMNWFVRDTGCRGLILEVRSGISDRGTDIVKAVCSIVPDDGGEVAPSTLMKKYGPVIVSGALYPLLGQTGKAWSDSGLAQVEMANWNAGLSEASLDGIVSDKNGPGDRTSGRRVNVIPYGIL